MKNPVKVLHVIRSESWGGLELYVAALLKKLKEEGAPVAAYCLSNSIIGENLKNAGIKIFKAKSGHKFSLHDILALRKILLQGGYSIVHSHTNSDALSCCLATVGLSECRHIFGLYMSTRPKRDLFHRLLYKNIDYLHSTSEIINEQVKLNYPIASNKIKLLRYGRETHEYQTDLFKRKLIRTNWGASDGKIVVGTICRIDPSKGIREFAESYLLLPRQLREKMIFWIVGEKTILHSSSDGKRQYEEDSDNIYEWLIDFIAQNNLHENILLIPYQQDLTGYLGALDVFVQASWNEMYSLVVLEALLMQLPVVGTNAGGTPEQLANGRGLLVAPRSSEELANAIAYIVDHQSDAIEMGSRGRAWVLQEHDWHGVLPILLALYSETVKYPATKHRFVPERRPVPVGLIEQ